MVFPPSKNVVINDDDFGVQLVRYRDSSLVTKL
jgi:hypothetical protein